MPTPMPRAYPFTHPLRYPILLERLREIGRDLGAIRTFREPREDAKGRILVKDNVGLDGFTTPGGSKALENLEVPDAFLVKKLKEAGYDIFGKTNMTELVGFVTTGHPKRGYSHLGGLPKNPYEGLPPGGSSTGSAIAACAGLCDAAIGTETRGSLMVPGILCRVFSFKPTRGTVSRSGILPLSSSFDTPGVLARDVKTIREVFKAVKGGDPEDPATVLADEIQETEDGRNFMHFKILVSPDGSDKEEAAKISQFLQSKGHKCETVERPEFANDYTEITSLDIQKDMDAFLGRWAKEGTPKSFKELYDFYRSHPETHPFGMDRLDLALTFPKKTPEAIAELARRNEEEARALIDQTLGEADFLISPDFIDWWSISGAPSITVPYHRRDGSLSAFMIGGKWKEDFKVLGIAEKLSG